MRKLGDTRKPTAWIGLEGIRRAGRSQSCGTLGPALAHKQEAVGVALETVTASPDVVENRVKPRGSDR